jgi:hypothetical protein
MGHAQGVLTTVSWRITARMTLELCGRESKRWTGRSEVVLRCATTWEPERVTYVLYYEHVSGIHGKIQNNITRTSHVWTVGYLLLVCYEARVFNLVILYSRQAFGYDRSDWVQTCTRFIELLTLSYMQRKRRSETVHICDCFSNYANLENSLFNSKL